MNNDEFLKKLLKEAEFESKDEALAATTLKTLLANPSEIVPPAGYEQKLLASLRAKLPSEQIMIPEKSSRSGASIFEGFFSFLRSPQVSWGTAGSLAIFIAVFALNRGPVQNPVELAESTDLLAQTASRGGEAVVNEWLASVGDTGIRSSTHRGLSSLADELEASENKAAVDKALDEVARSMGMKNL